MTYDITHGVDSDGWLVVNGEEGPKRFETRLDKEMAAILLPLLPGFLGATHGISVRSRGWDGDHVATFDGDDWEITDLGTLNVYSGDTVVASYPSGCWYSAGFVQPPPEPEADKKEDPGKLPDDAMWRIPDGPIVHAVMYRDHRMGTLCDSGAWGTPDLFTAVTEHVTCPACRDKLDPGRL